jgi:hypothetical protein
MMPRWSTGCCSAGIPNPTSAGQGTDDPERRYRIGEVNITGFCRTTDVTEVVAPDVVAVTTVTTVTEICRGSPDQVTLALTVDR